MAQPPLRLLAQDADDLAVLSAAAQDAVAKVGDIVFEPKARRLTIAFNRYRWESTARERVRRCPGASPSRRFPLAAQLAPAIATSAFCTLPTPEDQCSGATTIYTCPVG